jgi:Coenzyme PQQ synthesis protein D (PqqD)
MPIAVRPQSPRPEFIQRTFRTVPHVVSTRQADATVLLDPQRGVCYSLNEMGWRIWEQIGAGEPVAAVIRTLRQEYDVAPESFETDVAAFIDHLVKASLIEPVEG